MNNREERKMTRGVWVPLTGLGATFIATFMGIFVATALVAQTSTPQPSEKWEETPYLWAGKTLEELRPSVAKNVLPKYGELRFIYPSAESCLAPPDTDNKDTLARDLIWYQLETKEAVEVCLFRVFSALGDQAKIEAWLESQGFGSRFEVDQTQLGFLYGVENERITALSMTWLTSEQGALYGATERQRRKRARRVLSQTATIRVTENGRVLGARLTGQSAIWRE